MRLRVRTIVSIAALACFVLAAAFFTLRNIFRANNAARAKQVKEAYGSANSEKESGASDPFSANLPGQDAHLYLPPQEVLNGAGMVKHRGEVPGLLSEFEGTNVQDIDIRGSIRLSENTLVRAIRTRKGRPFSQKEWEQDFHRLSDTGLFLNVRITEPIKVPGGLRLTIDLVENPYVDALTFNGVAEMDAAIFGKSYVKGQALHLDRLEKAMAQFENKIFDKGRAKLAQMEIQRFAKENGFTDPVVDYAVDTLLTHNQNHGGKMIEVTDLVRVKYTISMGVRSRVRSLSLRNIAAFGEAVVLDEIQSKEDGAYSAELLESDRARIAAFYRRNGYAGVEVSLPEVTAAGEGISKLDGTKESLFDVSFRISEGPQYVVGNVSFFGNSTVSAKELARIVLTKPGALLIDDIVKTDLSRLESYYSERGWPGARVDAIRVRVTDPERLKFAANSWDMTFRVAEGVNTVKLPFATHLKIKSEDVSIPRDRMREKTPNEPPRAVDAKVPEGEHDEF